jgi:hypothetical protein
MIGANELNNKFGFLVLLQITDGIEAILIHKNKDNLPDDHDRIPGSGRSGFPEPELGEVELTLRIRCVNSTPDIVDTSLLNRLNPGITFVLLHQIFRCSCPIRLFRYG